MASDEQPELLWDGEGEHEVMSRELALHLVLQPLIGFVVLTIGTVPIPA